MAGIFASTHLFPARFNNIRVLVVARKLFDKHGWTQIWFRCLAAELLSWTLLIACSYRISVSLKAICICALVYLNHRHREPCTSHYWSQFFRQTERPPVWFTHGPTLDWELHTHYWIITQISTDCIVVFSSP